MSIRAKIQRYGPSCCSSGGLNASAPLCSSSPTPSRIFRRAAK